MTNAVEKRASWRLDLDLDDVKREFKGLGQDLRAVAGEITDLAKKTDQAANQMVSELRGVGGEIKTAITQSMGEAKQATEASTRAMVQGLDSVEGAIKDLAAAWRQAREETKSVGAQINQVLSTTKAQLTDVHKLVRQYNMSDWQKQADNYAQAIRKAQGEVNGLKKALAAANLEEKERLALEQQLARAQRNVGKLQSASKAHVALGIDAETGKTVDAIKLKVDALNQATRQHGMAEWQKAAEGYNQAIAQSKAHVAAMRQAIEGANVSEKDRIAILAKIADGERQILQLQQQSKVHVEQLRQAEASRALAARDVQGTLRDLNDGLQGVGVLSGVAFAALTAGLGGALTEFGNLEAELLKFGAVSDATAEEMKLIEEQALRIGSATKFTAQEVAAGQVELAKMGFSAQETADAMDAMVEAAIASGEGLSETSTVIASTLRMFNMQASEAGKVADIIARGANISAQSIGSFSNSIRYVGSAAAGANQDLVQISGLLAILADRGIKGTVAGNGLQIALLRLQAPTAAAAAAMDKLNLAIANTQGTADTSDDTLRPLLDIIKDIKAEFDKQGLNDIQQADILKDLFGEVSLNTMQIFMNTHNDVMDATMAKQKQFRGSNKETADQMKQGWNYAIEEMKGSINALQISIGGELAPTMLAFAKAVQTIADGFNAVPGPIKSVIAHLGLLLAAGAAALTGGAGLSMMTTAAGKGVLALDGLVGGKLVSSLGGLGNTVKGILPVIGRGFTALATGPVGVLIAAATALWLAYKTNLGNLRYHVDEFMGFMAEAWGPSMSEIVEGSKDTWAGFQQFMKGVFQWVSEGFLTVLGVADSFFNALMRIVSATGRLIPGIIDAWEKKDWGLLKSTIDELGNATEDLAAAMNPEQIMRNAERYREMAFKKFFDHEKKLEELKKKTQDTEKKTNHIADTGLNTQAKKLDLLDAELAKQKELLNNERKRAKLGESAATSAGPTHRVFDPNIAGAATNSPYGMRRSGMHRGNDSAQAAGRPILSQDAGVVAHVGDHGNQSWGKFIVVDNGDGTYWLYGHSSKIYAQINDRVEKKQRLALVGNTGHSFGSHIHTELRVGKPGLRGEGVIAGTKPINPNIGKETKGHDHAADAAAAEAEYFSKLIRLLEQYKVAYQRVMVSLKGEERTEAEGRVRQLEGEILDARQQVKDLGLDLAKAQAESAEAALESVREAISNNLKEIETAFGESVKAIEDHAEEGKKRFYAKLEKSDPQALANSFGEMQTWYSEAQATVEGLAAAVADAKQDISLMGPEERKQLQALEELLRKAEVQASRTAYQLREMYGSQEPYTTLNAPGAPNVRLRTGRPGTKTTEDAQIDFDQLWENMDRAADKGREFRDKMLANQEAMDLFSNAINSNAVDLKQLAKALGLSREEMAGFGLTLGTVDLDEFQKLLNLTDEQIAELAKALGDEDGLAIIERIFNRGTEETRKFNAALDETQTAIGNVLSIFGSLVEMIPDGLAELKQVGQELAQMMNSVGSSVKGVAEAIQNDDIPGAIAGTLQMGVQYWSFVLAQFGKLGDAVKRITDETKQLRRESRDLQLDAQEAELEGKTDPASQQTLAVMRKRRQLLPYADDYEDNFGMAIPVDPETGAFDPDAMEDYVNRKFQGNDRQKRLNALLAFKNQIIRVNGELQQELITMAAESAGQVAASVDAAQAYWDNLNREEANATDVAHLLDLSAGMDPKLREALRDTAEQIIAERNRITEEVIQGNQGPEELARRLTKFQVEAERMMGDALLAAQKETLDAAAKAQQEAFEAQQRAQEEALRRQQEALAAQQQRIRDAEDEGCPHRDLRRRCSEDRERDRCRRTAAESHRGGERSAREADRHPAKGT
jgi:TP901 family phage tail tape measure protein